MRVTMAVQPGRTPPRSGARQREGRARQPRTASLARGPAPPMTARRGWAEVSASQVRVISALRESGDLHIADRLTRCMQARAARRQNDGWPWACRSSGCVWCGGTLARRWWRGLVRWAMEDGTAPVTLAILPLHHRAGELPAAVARLRRALRDVRDRAALRRTAWGGVAVAEMATGDGTAFVLVRHPGVARQEVAALLRRRWPAAVVREVGTEEPSWSMSVEDAAELARTRRGVEPLRIVILPQRAANTGERHSNTAHETAEPFAPMPIAF